MKQSLLDKVKDELSKVIDQALVDRMLEHYKELNVNYYMGRYKPSELEGAQFTEVMMRAFEYLTTGSYTELTHQLDYKGVIEKLERLPSDKFHDSIRIHAPRICRCIYDIRHRRRVGHTTGDVDPNFLDATFVLSACKWMLGEFIRLYYTSSMKEAQLLVDSLIEIKIPIVQDFDGFLKILDPKLSIPKKTLILLYYRSKYGATFDELRTWISIKDDNHFNTVLRQLEKNSLIHKNEGRICITHRGNAYVVKRVNFQLSV
ncbi:MAG: hypothetical protein Q8O10_11045 [candidate division Zixibacteria bacterium]|nr:hypothetical protein [candidate division Zixibacteria bacterium]